jgi:ABC-2 type transport system permease protein
MAVSVRAKEVRVAQQLGTFASLPIIGVVFLMALNVIHPTFQTALVFAVVILAIDLRALRIVARMFNRERLVTGTKATRS